MNFDNKVLASSFFGDLLEVEPDSKVPCARAAENAARNHEATLSLFSLIIDTQHAAVKDVTYAIFQKDAVKVSGVQKIF